jgi:hypothetical protein
MSDFEILVLERLQQIAHELEEHTKLLRLLVDHEEPTYAKPGGITFRSGASHGQA